MKTSSLKTDLKPYSINLKTLSLLGTGFYLLGNFAHALPTKRGNAALPAEVVNQIAADPALKGVQVLADHDSNVKVFYVSPANRKPQAGSFIRTAEPSCPTIKGLYDQAFHLPTYQTPEDLMRVAADPNAAVSPFFFLHFAGSVRQGVVIQKIQESYNESEELLDTNRAAYDEYLGAKLKFESAQQGTQAVQAEIQRLDDVIKKQQDLLLIAPDAESREAARSALEAAIAHKREQYPDLARKLIAKEDTEADARQAFVQAHQGVAALLDNLRRSNERLEFNITTFEALRKVQLDGYSLALSTLEARENRSIGSANVAVKVWDDEVMRVDQIIKNAGPSLSSYSVQRLPIHNVALDGRYWEKETQSADGSGTGVGNGKVDVITNNPALAVGDEVKVDSPFRDSEGRAIEMLVKKLGQRDSFALDIPISAGTYCMTQGKAEEDRIEFEVEENGEIKTNVMTIRRFKSREEPVIKPSFALNYEYFVKAEPMNVACELNMDLFFQHISRSGSSGFLFWKKRWSSTEQTQIQNNGVKCDVKSSPIGDDINLQREMEAELVEGFSRDLAAEAILLRAKEWKVTASESALPERSKGFAMIGTGMIAVCGGNPYCMVGGIVLKSIEELFGSQTASGQSTYDYKTKLTRNFNYDGYTVDRSSVIIDAEIR